MGYLTGLSLIDPGVKRYNGGTSSFTMDDSGTTNGTLLWVDGVAQVPGTDYNVSGTTITTTTAAGAGTNNVVSLQLFSTGIINTTGDNTVSTAKIVDDSVTLAKMAAGTDGNIISYDTSGNPVAVATGNDGQVLTSSGAGAVCAFETITSGYTLGTEVATTSGTAATFTGIPSGTKRIIMNIAGFSQASANGDIVVRIGDSGGIETSSYISSGSQLYNATVSETVGETTGFTISGYADFDAAKIMSGSVHLSLQDAANFTWCSISLMTGAAGSPTDQFWIGAGEKALSAELTQISLTTVGGFTFDAGAVNIMYM